MSKTYLRRYTDLPALIYLLSTQTITLLDPQSWDDTNDSHYLTLYKAGKRLEAVLALCFSQADETYHQWRVFGGGSGGVCIRFNRPDLVKAVKKQSGLRLRSVTYLTLGKIRNKTLAVSDLPFLKRFAYEPEAEFRVIYESKTTKLSKLDIPIPLSCIDRITLSPWIHSTLSSQVKARLRSIPGCSALKIVRSTLIGNAEWKTLGEKSR